MSVNLTSALQNIGGRDPNFTGSGPTGGPVPASRSTGIVLLDSDTVTWSCPGPVYDTLVATAAGGSAPSGLANEVYATPNGSSGDASLRALVPADLPLATTSAAGAVIVGSGLSVSGGTISTVPSGMTLIASVTASGSESTVSFTGIPQSFSSLLLVDNATVSGGSDGTYTAQFNGDTGANYGWVYNNSINGVVTTGQSTSQTSANVGVAADVTSAHQMLLPGYSASTVDKNFISSQISAGSEGFILQQGGGNWGGGSGAGISSIVLTASANFTSTSKFSLYGLS